MGHANGLLFMVGALVHCLSTAAGCDMTCHYGKDSATLVSWLTTACPDGQCNFDTGAGCEDPLCATGRVRTLLATTPVGCDDQFNAAWRTLRKTCGRMDGVCCPACVGPIMTPCDKNLRPVHKQVMSVYTAVAATALVALWLRPSRKARALPTKLKTKVAQGRPLIIDGRPSPSPRPLSL